MTRWLLVAGISYTLMGSLSYLLTPVGTPRVTSVAGTAAASDDSRGATVRLIQSKRIFGTPQAAASAEPEPAEVVTSLPLELRGVFVTEVSGESVAILALRNHRAEIYSVGEMVAGKVELVAVLSDHVVLNDGGRREILRFSKRTEASRHSPGVLPADAPDPVANYRYVPVQRVEDHPDRYEPGFSAVLGRVVEDANEGG